MNDLSDNELQILKLKYEEKLSRYIKCYNECTEYVIIYLKLINDEVERRIYKNVKNNGVK